MRDMMAPRLSAAAALVLATPAALALAAPVALAQTPDPSASTTSPRKKQSELYAPSPERASYEVSSRFFKAYGMTLRPIELDPGVRLGTFATAPKIPSGAADVRAGVDPSRSPWQVPLLAALLALLAAVAFFLTAPTAARAVVPDGFVGITSEDAYTGKDPYAQKQLAKQNASGFTIARQVFRWNEIEPKNNEFDFSATDRFVLNAADAGIRVLPLLQGEPKWATSRPKGNKSRALYPPKDPTHFGRFAAKLAERYGPNGLIWTLNPEVTKTPITSYQLWNEPNFPLYWANKPNGAAYAKLVITASQMLRAVQPDAYVVSAGIPDSTLGQKPATFVKAMLKANAGPALNAIGIHPYAIDVKSVMKITRGLRKTINAAGGKNLDLWVTEIGWAAGGPKTPKRTVTAARQGPIVAAVFKDLAKSRKSLKLRGVIYFAWRDSAVYPGGKDFWGLHTGLHDRKGKAKPALNIVAKTLLKLK